MRTTLRRSCNACAKAKHSCDLGTPKCSRCVKRKVTCTYANEPLSSSSSSSSSEPSVRGRSVDKSETKRPSSKSHDSDAYHHSSMALSTPVNASFDPFDSYPATRLPRVHVQRLIQHCKPIHIHPNQASDLTLNQFSRASPSNTILLTSTWLPIRSLFRGGRSL